MQSRRTALREPIAPRTFAPTGPVMHGLRPLPHAAGGGAHFNSLFGLEVTFLLTSIGKETRNANPSPNRRLAKEWFECIARLGGDAEGMRAAASFMEGSTAIVHGEVTPCSVVPKLFGDETRDLMAHAAHTMHGILCKVIRRYLDDPAYRELFSFDRRLRELILLPCGHDALVPFARYDIFLDENTGDYTFCELNADGSSGMNEDREVARATRKTGAYPLFAGAHRIEGNELFASWVDVFLDIHSRSAHPATRPHVAICDYLECATLGEFEEYRDEFERHGIPCTICDVRDLAMHGDRLCTPDGCPVDAIWRRCVTNDILSHWDESQTFIDAVRHGRVVLIGGFSGHIVHDKQIFRVLRMPQTKVLLADEENRFVEAHVPYTTFLDEGFVSLDEIKGHKDSWVIKPCDHYGADEVHLGIEETQKRWVELVDAFANSKTGCAFLAQTFARPFRTKAIALSDAATTRSYANLSGLYVFDGVFKGVFSRLGPGEIVTGLAGGLTAATFWVDCERP